MIAPVDAQALQGLREETRRTWASVIGDGASVTLLDMPSHRNAGDSMIWAGEMAYLADRRIDFISDLRRYDPEAIRRATSDDSVILLHGGGNFGDVWPIFQAGRERVIADFPDRKIVQLPQTLKFHDLDNAKRANEILAAHPDFTVLVRDTRSMRSGTEWLPDVALEYSPDAALGWSPPHREVRDRGILVLQRNDHESRFDLAGAFAPLLSSRDTITDWTMPRSATARWHALKTPGRLTSFAPGLRRNGAYQQVLQSAGRALMGLNLRHAVELFEGRSLVITDRLHAHVLATLLGIPSIVFDNSYGKVSSIVGDYTASLSTTHFVQSTDEGIDVMRTLASSS